MKLMLVSLYHQAGDLSTVFLQKQKKAAQAVKFLFSP